MAIDKSELLFKRKYISWEFTEMYTVFDGAQSCLLRFWFRGMEISGNFLFIAYYALMENIRWKIYIELEF